MSEEKGKGRGKLFASLTKQPSPSQTNTESSTSSTAHLVENEEKPTGATTVRSRGRGVLLELLTRKVCSWDIFQSKMFLV